MNRRFSEIEKVGGITFLVSVVLMCVLLYIFFSIVGC
jgi:hypothetical protein